MSEYRVGASIQGVEGPLGSLDALIVDPTAGRITQLVVAYDKVSPRVLVPEAKVRTATPEVVTVDLDAEALRACDRFDAPDFNEPADDNLAETLVLDPDAYFYEPYASPLDGWVLGTHERVPKGEVSLRRGAVVEDREGAKLGHVDELLVDPADGHLTHVVLREHHLLGHDDDVVIPLGHAVKVDIERVVLDLDVAEVHALERIPVVRHGHVRADEGND